MKFKRRYEEILPLICMAIIMILFVYGIAGILKVGVWGVLLLAVLPYGITIYELCEDRKQSKNSLKKLYQNLFTPGFIMFFGVYVSFVFSLDGKLACVWDELSHWIDTVKIMTTLDDLRTNTLAHASFHPIHRQCHYLNISCRKFICW